MNIKVSNTCLNFSIEIIHLRFVYFSIAFAHISIYVKVSILVIMLTLAVLIHSSA